jgi:ABC-type nitrate/sulfonate/bicarbonate transport system permease component
MSLLAAGYLIACALGILLGIAMGYSPRANGLFEPLVELIRPIPKPALVPPLFLFLGIGPTTMVVIVVLAAFFPVLIAALQGVRGVDKVLIDTARTFRLSSFALVTRIVLPSALPMILTGMRVSLALSLALVVLAEMIAGEAGIGYLILDMQRSFKFTEMYCWVLLLAAIGYLLNLLFETAETRVVAWHGR